MSASKKLLVTLVYHCGVVDYSAAGAAPPVAPPLPPRRRRFRLRLGALGSRGCCGALLELGAEPREVSALLC